MLTGLDTKLDGIQSIKKITTGCISHELFIYDYDDMILFVLIEITSLCSHM